LMQRHEGDDIWAAIETEAHAFSAQLANPATQAALTALLEKRAGRSERR